MTYCDECCDGACIDHYDACCDRCCPGISHDVRDFFVNCGCWLACIMVIASVVVLVAGFAFTHHVSVIAAHASLARFALATSPTTALAYNLSLTLSVHNPNWAMNMEYTDRLVAAYGFNGQSFDRVKLEEKGKKLAARKTHVYRLRTAAAKEYVVLGGDGIDEFRRQRLIGEFQVEVVVTSEVRYTLHITRCTLKATCVLKLKLSPPGSPAAVAKEVRCKLA